MSQIFQSVTELIGGTPLLEVHRLAEAHRLNARILVKLEYFNPAGSVKDRVALEMINDAEGTGKLQPGATIIEPTSGNTGIGLAAVAAAKGYHCIFVMPESMSIERRKLLQGYGAEIVLTDASKGMQGAIEKADELARTIQPSFVPSQFDNPANAAAHEKTTGPEIWEATEGEVDAFIAGVGTGGTVTGVGRFLKQKRKDIHVVVVEPAGSPVISGGLPGPHMLQGIGAGFVPRVFDRSVCDEVMLVTDNDALMYARELAQREGILVGISSGAALSAAIDLAKRPNFAGKTIVVLLPDTGERYLSTALFESEED
ncbi:MAG TPA: cysteine synthase A [Clostridiaceae bacterium]|nr:cysteine synthase A [Clostridiaceae bacterium]